MHGAHCARLSAFVKTGADKQRKPFDAARFDVAHRRQGEPFGKLRAGRANGRDARSTISALDKLGMTDYLVGSDGGNFGYEQDGEGGEGAGGRVDGE
jgi:hypothetical protein